MFKKFKFIVLIDEIEIELRHSEDLKAALNYFENKLKIRMIKGDDDCVLQDHARQCKSWPVRAGQGPV